MSLVLSQDATPHAFLPDEGDVRLAKYKGTFVGVRFFNHEHAFASALGDLVDDPQEVDRIVQHEASHVRVAKQVGVEVTRFAFDLNQGGKPKRLYVGMYGGTLPKLALAAIFAAPIDPSEYDLTDIAKLGYTGIENVGDRVVEWNKSNTDMHIPVPLSYPLPI